LRAIVTGAAGFVGSHLAERLLANGDAVLGVDSLTDYYDVQAKQRNLKTLLRHPLFTFERADLLEADLIKLFRGTDIIFHLAAQPGVRKSWGPSFETYLLKNVLATQRVLESVSTLRTSKLVFASSSSVYGDSESYPTSEMTLPRPVSPYGVTKLAAEALCHLYWKNYGMPTVSVRYFTIYGPRQRPDMAFNRLIRAALDASAFELYGDGTQTRDFTFVSDAVEGTLLAATAGANGGIYNIGGGSRTSLMSVVQTVESLLGKRISLVNLPPQKGDVRDTAADISRAVADLGYAPSIRLEEGLRAQVQWARESQVGKALNG
jgi:nucleoside-diphosphate-sugar epimerase